MSERVIVKGADSVIRVEHPIDEINGTVIDSGATAIARFYDTNFDGPVQMRSAVLTKPYEDAGALIADVDTALGFRIGDLVTLALDDGRLFKDVVGAATGTIVTLTNSAGLAAAAGAVISTYQMAATSFEFSVPIELAKRFRPDDPFTIQHVENLLRDELTVLRTTIFNGQGFVITTTGTTVVLEPGATFKKKLGSNLDTFVLYGTPSLTEEDWGWQRVLSDTGDTQDELVPGMRVRVEYEFNGGADLLWRENLFARVVAG